MVIDARGIGIHMERWIERVFKATSKKVSLALKHPLSVDIIGKTMQLKQERKTS